MPVRLVKPRVQLIKPRVSNTSQLDQRTGSPGDRWGKGRGGRPWRRRRDRILERDEYLCQPCKRAGELVLATEVDHIVPQFLGGSDDDENLQGICEPCHKAKRQREAAEARRLKGGG